MATNKLKFGTETPTKLYIGATEVTKAYMGETLVYEKSLPSGETWVINETITVEPYAYSTLISFVSNNQNYGVFYIDPDGDDIPKIVYADKVVAANVWDVVYNYGWTNQAYRTVTFATPPTGNLLTWLQANAVKQ